MPPSITAPGCTAKPSQLAEDFVRRRAVAHAQNLFFADRVARDGDDLARLRRAVGEGVEDVQQRLGRQHQIARFLRRAAAAHLAPVDGVDGQQLVAGGIFRLEQRGADKRFVVYGVPQRADGLGAVFLDGDDRALDADGVHQNLRAVDDLLRVVGDQPRDVRGIGVAFQTVDDDALGLPLRARQLSIDRHTAHGADHARLLETFGHVLVAERDHRRLDRRQPDRLAAACAAHCDEAVVGRRHLAADRRQDAKAVGVFGHPLALGDRIACCHGRQAAVNQLQPDDGGQRRVLYRQHDILSSGFERQSADEGQSQADPSFPKRVWEWTSGRGMQIGPRGRGGAGTAFRARHRNSRQYALFLFYAFLCLVSIFSRRRGRVRNFQPQARQSTQRQIRSKRLRRRSCAVCY